MQGKIVKSLRGHDKDKFFVVVMQDDKFVYIADGKRYVETKVVLVPDKDGYAYTYIRLPKYSGRHFAFEIVSDTPDVGILNVGFDYIIKKSIKEFTK